MNKQIYNSLDILYANNLLQGSREDKDRQGFLKTKKIDFLDAKQNMKNTIDQSL